MTDTTDAAQRVIDAWRDEFSLEEPAPAAAAIKEGLKKHIAAALAENQRQLRVAQVLATELEHKWADATDALAEKDAVIERLNDVLESEAEKALDYARTIAAKALALQASETKLAKVRELIERWRQEADKFPITSEAGINARTAFREAAANLEVALSEEQEASGKQCPECGYRGCSILREISEEQE